MATNISDFGNYEAERTNQDDKNTECMIYNAEVDEG
jgi:hypothetical protein